MSMRRNVPVLRKLFGSGSMRIHLTMLLVCVVHFEHELIGFFFVRNLTNECHLAWFDAEEFVNLRVV